MKNNSVDFLQTTDYTEATFLQTFSVFHVLSIKAISKAPSTTIPERFTNLAISLLLSITAEVSTSSYLFIFLHPIPWKDIAEERFHLNRKSKNNCTIILSISSREQRIHQAKCFCF